MSYLISLQSRQCFFKYLTRPQHAIDQDTRSAVTEFSVRSSARMRRYLRCCVADYGFLATLTYPDEYPTDGVEVKRHMATFVKRLRRACQRHMRPDEMGTWSIFWFLEFQKRGAPHFHFFVTHPPGSAIHDPQAEALARIWIASNWYDVVGSNDIKHLSAGTQFDKLKHGRNGTISYAAKYARKAEQKKVPEEYKGVGRFWGVSGLRRTLSADILITDSHYYNKDVQYEIKKLKNWINDLEKEGEIDVHRDMHGEMRSLYIKSDKMAQSFKNRIDRFRRGLSSLVSYNPNYFGYDQYIYDIEMDGETEGKWHYLAEQ